MDNAVIYQDSNELIRGYINWLEAYAKPVTGDEPEVIEFRRLFDVYHNALDNPPEGVIGVGAITYAEQKLVEAQQ